MNPAPAPIPAGPARRPRILVADDDEAVRRGLRVVLQMEGYDVVTAINGVHAVATFSAQPCALAVLDVNMPIRNGWATAGDLHAMAPGLPIVIITAQSGQHRVAEASGLEFMEKPIDLPFLLQRIASRLAEVSSHEFHTA